jgi:hypothetical protein
VDAVALVGALQAAPDVNYIGAPSRSCAPRRTRAAAGRVLRNALHTRAGLVTSTVIAHAQRLCGRGVSASVFTPRSVAGVRLLPLAAYLDSTHISPVAWYRCRVFGLARAVALPRGCYLEDTLGQAQLAEVRAGGAEAHARYGTYLAHEGGAQAVVVTHLDGHDSYCGRPDWRKWRHLGAHTSEEEWAAREAAGDLSYDAPPRYACVPKYYDCVDADGACAHASGGEEEEEEEEDRDERDEGAVCAAPAGAEADEAEAAAQRAPADAQQQADAG